MKSYSFEKLTGLAAIAAGVAAFLYAYAFIILSRSDPQTGGLFSALFLLLQGLLITKVYVALYHRVYKKHPSVSLWALILGIASALGMAIHGGYDLANAINLPDQIVLALANLPSQIDPRGLLTFGIGGWVLFTFSWLIQKTKTFSDGLVWLGYASAIMMVVLYVGRLTVLSPASPIILWPAIINGFIVSPLWYIWVGLNLWSKKA